MFSDFWRLKSQTVTFTCTDTFGGYNQKTVTFTHNAM